MSGQRNKGGAVSAPSASTQPVEKTEQPVPKGAKEPVEPTDIFHVVGPSTVRRDGKKYGPGELLELTEAEATAIGTLVKRGEPEPVEDRSVKRKAGQYRIVGPGCIRAGNINREPGDTIQLTADQAEELGDLVEPAR
jgi:hypothetical protein